MLQRFCQACSVFAALFAVLVVPACLWSQAPVSAPVPAEVFSAKTIFLANSGEDEFVDASEAIGIPEQTYDRMYAALVGWGRYKVVRSPGKADLVLEVRSRIVEEGHGATLFEGRRIDYRLLDGSTHTVLWAGSIHVQRAVRQRTLDRNLNDAIEFLVNDLKQIVNRAAAAPA